MGKGQAPPLLPSLPLSLSLSRKLAAAVLLSGLSFAGAANPVSALAPPVVGGVHAVPERAIEPQICSTCAPPLTYHGGPVLSTSAPAGLTVTPIFWQPLGGSYVFPPKYESIIDTFITNVAAASGTRDNVFSVDTEYYQLAGTAKQYISYDVHAQGPVVDTDPFPANGCQPAPGFRACLSDKQLQAELGLITSDLKLPSNLAHFYPLFLPPGVETENVDGSNSDGGYCGYHRAFGATGDKTVYADLPYEAHGCSAGQAPNGDLVADGEVNTLSHEMAEAMTDPLELQPAWTDPSGNEVADMCAHVYGPPLGSTSRSDPEGSEYNQVINGAPYYIQEMFSNLAYTREGLGKGCAPSEELADDPGADGSPARKTAVAYTLATATPDTLAGAKATATIAVTVLSSSGKAIAGDHVYFNTGLRSGTGACGQLSRSEATTAADGVASVTYTASSANVSCWVTAVEAEGGQAVEPVVYQGTTRHHVPAMEAAVPAKLEAGASPVLFTFRAGNPSSLPLSYARMDLVISGATASSPSLEAKQVHLSYSVHGPKGPFTDVALRGSTRHGVISAFLGPERGTTMPAGWSEKLTFRIALASDVTVSTAGPLFTLKTYLQQVNVASGSTSTLANTYGGEVRVPTTAPNNTLLYIVGAAAVAVVLLAILLAVLWRRRGKRRRAALAAAP